MRPPSACRVLAAVLLVALAGTSARADFFYNWDPESFTLYSDSSGMHVELADAPQSAVVSGNQSMVATALKTFINPDAPPTDTFSFGQTGTLRLTIVDGTETGSTTFNLGLSGELSRSDSNLALQFLDGSTRSLTVNGEEYGVALTLPGSVPGQIRGLITVGPQGGPDPGDPPGGEPPPAHTTPEPSAVVLTGTGVVLVALRRLSRWRRDEGRLVTP